MTDPGWYPDPEGDTSRARYWDGQAWTDRTRDRASSGTAPSPAAAEGSARPWWRRPVIPIAALVAIGVGVGAFVVFAGSDEASGAEVILQPSASAGVDPFTDSVASKSVTELTSGETELAGDPVEGISGGDQSVESIAGSAPGLYGGTGEEAVCDPQAMVAFLEQNPDKAAAFASVVGVKPKKLGAYISTLTPVLLREDTRVTNHGFVDGQANGFDAVLEAGSAVMVDDRGVPRVRCACGNPLSEPVATDSTPDYTGEAWDGFDDNHLVAVAPSDEPVETFELVNVTTGESYEQAAGGSGDVRDHIIDFGGIGNVRIGMTEREAEQATGTDVVFNHVSSSYDCASVTFPELGSVAGLAVDGRTINELYLAGDVGPPPRTPAGITLGSSASEVEAAYPGLRHEEGYYDPSTERLIAENDAGEILAFRTDDRGRVVAITAGLAPDVAPEGCA